MSVARGWGAGSDRVVDLWYAAAVAVGAVLMVATAISQPYNQNEFKQMAPYGSSDIATITGGTRQPPLDPLLGALVQHVLGEGQLRQRLVPIFAGISTLVLMSLFLRRLNFGYAGVFAVAVLATQPLMVHYAAYTRPYALPLFLMMAFAYAAWRWLTDRSLAWLIVSAVAALLLPLSRLPEPTVLLATCAAALAWLAFRGQRSWSATAPLIGISLGALVVVGYPMYLSLASKQTGTIFDPSPAGVAHRFNRGVHELVSALLPSLGDSFPWWPVTIAVIVAAFAIPASRRRLFEIWVWWPLLLAPLMFALGYYFLNPHSLELRPYRDRYAYFFLPAFVFLVAALATVVRDLRKSSRRVKVGFSILLSAALLSQLPATAEVVTDKIGPDYRQAAEVIADEVPDGAIVLYDSPAAPGPYRQPFSGKPRYLGPIPFLIEVNKVVHRPEQVGGYGPVYVLVLDGVCSSSVYCDSPEKPWDHDVSGFRVAARFDHFRLYAPDAKQSGTEGVVDALLAFADAFGPRMGMMETFAAAAVLNPYGDAAQGRALIRGLYRHLDADTARHYRDIAKRQHLNIFRGHS